MLAGVHGRAGKNCPRENFRRVLMLVVRIRYSFLAPLAVPEEHVDC